MKSIVLNVLLLLAMLIGMAGSPNEVSQAQELTSGPSADVLGVALGVHLRPSETYGSDLQAFNSQVGKNAAILMYFTDFHYGLDPYLYNKLTSAIPANEMPVILLTLEPKNGTLANGCDKNYSGFVGYDALLSGKCDAFIRNFAKFIADRGNTRFLIRFAHEMNISDSAYWPGHYGKGPQDYIQLYRHVVQVFSAAMDAAGGQNAEFVWSPNYFSNPAESWNYYDQYYPGDEYVDWIGLSGYNWYPQSGEPNRSFKQLFGDLDGTDAYYSDQGFHPGILYDLSCRYAKPIILAEFGAAHNSGTVQQKAAWITDAYNKLAAHPFVRAVVWFNDFAYAGNSTDFRVAKAGPTSPEAVPGEITAAYKNSVYRSQYTSVLPDLKAATPPERYCWTDIENAGQAVYNLSRSGAMVEADRSVDVTLAGMMIIGDPTIEFGGLPAGISASVIEDALFAPWGEADLRFTISSKTAVGTYPMVVTVNTQQGAVHLPFQVNVVDQLYETRLPMIRR